MQGELFALPRGATELHAAVERARALVTKRAALASASALLPVPGLDLAADMATVIRLVPMINHIFGLTPDQIEKLDPRRKAIVHQAILVVGGAMIGKIVTRDLVCIAIRKAGIALTLKQATKLVPLAGQAASAVLSFAALRYVCNQHIRECIKVVESITAREGRVGTG